MKNSYPLILMLTFCLFGCNSGSNGNSASSSNTNQTGEQKKVQQYDISAGNSKINYNTQVSTYGYIANNNNNTVTKCQINGQGEMLNCSNSGANLIMDPEGITINNEFAYITNFNIDTRPNIPTITICNISNNGDLSSCRDSGANFHLKQLDLQPYNITFNAGYAYITNDANHDAVIKCDVNNDGSLSNCNDSGASLLSAPDGIVFNGNFAYITNMNNNTITQCEVDSSGNILNCKNSGAGLLSGPGGISFNSNYAYITNMENSTVTECSVDSDGSLSSCRDSNANLLSWPTSIVFKPGFAYITNFNSNDVTVCEIEGSTGSLTNCNIATADLAAPDSIYLYSPFPSLPKGSYSELCKNKHWDSSSTITHLVLDASCPDIDKNSNPDNPQIVYHDKTLDYSTCSNYSDVEYNNNNVFNGLLECASQK